MGRGGILLGLLSLAFLPAFCASGLAAPAPAADTVEGRWLTMGDESGKPEAVVRLYRDGIELKGELVEVFDPDAQVCGLCPGDKKGKPLKGLEFLWGFRRHGGKWNGGRVLDPESGKIYQAEMILADHGQRLRLRGYLGVPWLGRTQTWVRTAN